MTYGQDSGQPGQYPQQGYGQGLSAGPAVAAAAVRPETAPAAHGRAAAAAAALSAAVRAAYPPQQYAPVPYQQPQYYPQQYAQVAPKSAGLAIFLGLLLPGLGCMYAGKTGLGVALLAAWLVSIPLLFVFGIGFFTALGAWIASESVA